MVKIMFKKGGKLALALVLAVLLMSGAAYCASVTVRSTTGTQTNSGVTDETTGTWVSKLSTLEILSCGPNGVIDPPSATGGPGGDDVMIAVARIVYGIGDTMGRFTVSPVTVSSGQKLYVRSWNGSTEAEAAAYGNSAVTTVPSVFDGDYWDVGPGGGWNTPGSNLPAFSINTPSPLIAPVITSVTPAVTYYTGPMITIEGSKLGSGGAGDYVRISGTNIPASACINWTPTSIGVACYPSMEAGAGVSVMIHAGGQDGTPDTSLTINPRITAAAPTVNIVTGVTSVVIDGGGFGAGSPTVTFNTQGTNGTPSLNGSRITVTVPAEATDGNLSVTNNTRTSNTWAFTMATPVLGGIAPSEGNVGDAVVLTGSNFGIVSGADRGGSATYVTFNGTKVPYDNFNSWADTSISFNVPSTDDPGAVSVTVTSGGHTTSTSQSYTVTPEIISIVSPYYIGNTGSPITINGTALRSAKGSSTVTVGEYTLTDITLWSATQIRGNLPNTIEAATRDVSCVIENSGPFPTNMRGLSCNPHVTSIVPNSGEVGSAATINGFGFGAVKGSSRARFSSNIVTTTSWSNTAIDITVPGLLSNTYPVAVDVLNLYGTLASDSDNYTIGGMPSAGPQPIITEVKFNGRPYLAGEVVSATPNITALVTCDNPLDETYCVVEVDGVPVTQYTKKFEDAPGVPLPNAKILTIRLQSAIPAHPVTGHTLRIEVRSVTMVDTGTWTGSLVVMRGDVQMIGSAYNYPNPFRPLSSDTNQNTTRILYNLSVNAEVTLIIYDITGHEVYRKSYHSGTSGGQAGLNSVPFNGQSMFGEALGNGMYLYKLISGGKVIGSGKLVVLD